MNSTFALRPVPTRARVSSLMRWPRSATRRRLGQVLNVTPSQPDYAFVSASSLRRAAGWARRQFELRPLRNRRRLSASNCRARRGRAPVGRDIRIEPLHAERLRLRVVLHIVCVASRDHPASLRRCRTTGIAVDTEARVITRDVDRPTGAAPWRRAVGRPVELPARRRQAGGRRTSAPTVPPSGRRQTAGPRVSELAAASWACAQAAGASNVTAGRAPLRAGAPRQSCGRAERPGSRPRRHEDSHYNDGTLPPMEFMNFRRPATRCLRRWLRRTSLARSTASMWPRPMPASAAIFALTDERRTLLAMDAPPDKEDIRPYLHVARLLEHTGVHVPHVHAADLAADSCCSRISARRLSSALCEARRGRIGCMATRSTRSPHPGRAAARRRAQLPPYDARGAGARDGADAASGSAAGTSASSSAATSAALLRTTFDRLIAEALRPAAGLRAPRLSLAQPDGHARSATPGSSISRMRLPGPSPTTSLRC